MGMGTGIAWTQDSWNPIRARNTEDGSYGWHCVHASAECEFCYAEVLNVQQRHGTGTGLPYVAQSGKKVEIYLSQHGQTAWDWPLRTQKPRVIFPCSMTDLFGEFVTDEMLDTLFAVIALSPQHIFQCLTKRAKRMREYFAPEAHGGDHALLRVHRRMKEIIAGMPERARPKTYTMEWPLQNAWLGVSIGTPDTIHRIVDLRDTVGVPVKWISYEPAIEEVEWALEFDRACYAPNWLVTGGESGTDKPKSACKPGEKPVTIRPFDMRWAERADDACREYKVAHFIKQMGSKPVYNGHPIKLSKKGEDPSEWAPSLRVRQFPVAYFEWMKRTGQAASMKNWDTGYDGGRTGAEAYA